MTDPIQPDLGAVDEMACYAPANDNDRTSGPCMLRIAFYAACAAVLIAALSPVWM